MSNPSEALGYLQPHVGVPTLPIDSKLPGRAPTTSDINYPIGQEWIYNSNEYILVAKSGGVATWVIGGSVILPTSITDHALVVGSGTAALRGIPVGATGQVLVGITGQDPAFSNSLILNSSLLTGATIQAASGNITATNGNFVSSTSGNGILLNSPAATGPASSPLAIFGRSGRLTFTGVSIAGGADLTLTMTNAKVIDDATQIIWSFTGATTGAALTIKSETNSSGSSVLVITNGTGATTSVANIVLTFMIIN